MAASDPERVTCASLTRAGRRCKAAPLKGRDVCLAHADVQTRETTKFGGRQPGAGRPRKQLAPDALRALLEQHPEVVLRPLFRVLGYDVQCSEQDELTLVPIESGGAKLYGIANRDGSVNMSEHNDYRMQMQAAAQVLDRVYGKPRQMAELPSEDAVLPDQGEGLNMRLLRFTTDEELEQLGEISARVEARARSQESEQPPKENSHGRTGLSVVR